MPDPESNAPAEQLGQRGTPNLAIIGQLLGDPARLAMLQALMSGRALTATELAGVARIAASSASAHLARLVDAGLLIVQRQGRHRYHRLAGSDVADLLERLMSLADRLDATHLVTGPADPALRRARVCYDHLAGDVAVRFFEAAAEHGWFESQTLPDETTTVAATPLGLDGLSRLGVDVAVPRDTRRPTCRACMDWSERRHHLAGTFGARLLDLCLSRGWARRTADSRAIVFRAQGERALFAVFGRGA